MRQKYKGRGFYTKSSSNNRKIAKSGNKGVDPNVDDVEIRKVPATLEKNFNELLAHGGKGPELCEAISQKIWGAQRYTNTPQTFDGMNIALGSYADVKFVKSSINRPLQGKEYFERFWHNYVNLSPKQEMLLLEHGTSNFCLVIYAFCLSRDKQSSHLYSIYVTSHDKKTGMNPVTKQRYYKPKGIKTAYNQNYSCDYAITNNELAKKYNIKFGQPR